MLPHMLNILSRMTCIVHIEGNKGVVLHLSDHSADVLSKSVKEEPEKSVCVGVDEDNVVVIEAVIHKGCYSRLTNKKKLENAKRNYSEVSLMLIDLVIQTKK